MNCSPRCCWKVFFGLRSLTGQSFQSFRVWSFPSFRSGSFQVWSFRVWSLEAWCFRALTVLLSCPGLLLEGVVCSVLQGLVCPGLVFQGAHRLAVEGASDSPHFEDTLSPMCISQNVFIKSFCKSQFPHKSVNLFFICEMIKDKWTILWVN